MRLKGFKSEARKGITLPVNAVIIIALAVMVLLMIAAFFGGGAAQINKAALENAWSRCCSTIQSGVYNCNQSAELSKIDSGIDINSNGTTEDCHQICNAKFGGAAKDEKCVCACPGCCT